MLKVRNRSTRTRCEICSKLIIKTSGRCHWVHSGVFIFNSEYVSHLILVSRKANLELLNIAKSHVTEYKFQIGKYKNHLSNICKSFAEYENHF